MIFKNGVATVPSKRYYSVAGSVPSTGQWNWQHYSTVLTVIQPHFCSTVSEPKPYTPLYPLWYPKMYVTFSLLMVFHSVLGGESWIIRVRVWLGLGLVLALGLVFVDSCGVAIC